MASNWLISTFVFTSICHVLLAGVLPDQRDVDGKKDADEVSFLKSSWLVAKNKFKHLSVGRPSHLEAVPLERNGALNKEFRREVLLGEDTGSMKDDESRKQEHPGQDPSQINEKIREMLKRYATNICILTIYIYIFASVFIHRCKINYRIFYSNIGEFNFGGRDVSKF